MKTPQRKPNKYLSGEELLNKLAKEPTVQNMKNYLDLSPLKTTPPEKKQYTQPDPKDIYKPLPPKK